MCAAGVLKPHAHATPCTLLVADSGSDWATTAHVDGCLGQDVSLSHVQMAHVEAVLGLSPDWPRGRIDSVISK